MDQYFFDAQGNLRTLFCILHYDSAIEISDLADFCHRAYRRCHLHVCTPLRESARIIEEALGGTFGPNERHFITILLQLAYRRLVPIGADAIKALLGALLSELRLEGLVSVVNALEALPEAVAELLVYLETTVKAVVQSELIRHGSCRVDFDANHAEVPFSADIHEMIDRRAPPPGTLCWVLSPAVFRSTGARPLGPTAKVKHQVAVSRVADSGSDETASLGAGRG